MVTDFVEPGIANTTPKDAGTRGLLAVGCLNPRPDKGIKCGPDCVGPALSYAKAAASGFLSCITVCLCMRVRHGTKQQHNVVLARRDQLRGLRGQHIAPSTNATGTHVQHVGVPGQQQYTRVAHSDPNTWVLRGGHE
jgi:hypothetical protein